MTDQPNKFVEACEALAEAFESSGRMDLASLCDRAAYWLNGGNGVDCLAIQEIVASCRETLEDSLKSNGTQEFIAQTTGEALDALRSIETALTSNLEPDPKALIQKAAKIQALAILAQGLFQQ